MHQRKPPGAAPEPASEGTRTSVLEPAAPVVPDASDVATCALTEAVETDAAATRIERPAGTAASSAPEAALPKELIGDRWQVISRLGSGGFAEVFRARDTRSGLVVALKVLRGELAHNPSILERFRREIDHITTLSHPSIARMFDVGLTADRRPYLAMELLHGRTLTSHVRARGRLSVREVLSIMGPLCDALALAHARGVIHRDITSSNVFLADNRPTGRVVLLDFGIAKPLDAPRLTASREIVGTPSAMAPEQISGGVIGPHTDVYLLGLLLFLMLTGRRPYPADTAARAWELLSKHRPSISDHVAVAPAIERVVSRAMRLPVAERFASARELWEALSAAVHDETEQRTSEATALFVELRLAPDVAADPPDELLDRMDEILSEAQDLAEHAGLAIHAGGPGCKVDHYGVLSDEVYSARSSLAWRYCSRSTTSRRSWSWTTSGRWACSRKGTRSRAGTCHATRSSSTCSIRR